MVVMHMSKNIFTHFVISSLQISVLVMCHTRELAFQISKEYERFSKYMSSVKCAVFFGGLSIKKDEEVLKKSCPHIVVGTPGRILALIRNKTLNLKNVKHFVLDECDKMLEQLGGFNFVIYGPVYGAGYFPVYQRSNCV